MIENIQNTFKGTISAANDSIKAAMDGISNLKELGSEKLADYLWEFRLMWF